MTEGHDHDHDHDTISLRTSRPQSLIFTIYGAYSRSLDGWIAVATLLKLLRELDVDDSAVRSALSRLKRRGALLAESRDGFAGYALSVSAREAFDIGDARVLQRRELGKNNRWVLVAFSIPEKSRDLRYRLRSRLTGVGFGQVTGGLWIAPISLRPDAELVINNLKVGHYVHLFEAEHLGDHTSKESTVAQWWDLERIADKYTQFNRAFAHLQKSFESGDIPVTPATAFREYTKILTAWRPLPYLDPGLSTTYLPPEWSGTNATELFFYFHDLLGPLAQSHVRHTVTENRALKK